MNISVVFNNNRQLNTYTGNGDGREMKSFKKWIPTIVGALITIAGIVLDVQTYIGGDYKNKNYA